MHVTRKKQKKRFVTIVTAHVAVIVTSYTGAVVDKVRMNIIFIPSPPLTHNSVQCPPACATVKWFNGVHVWFLDV